MNERNRRSFLKTSVTGLLGGLAVPALGANFDKLPDFSLLDSNEEDYWTAVKAEFKFAPSLRYFNNGSLGPSPIPVQRATEKYREMLDGFPSKYMWGGWNDEKEETRSKVAALLKVDSEEIALIHNTTEGMNLIARSFDLEMGDEVILADHEHSSGTICWEVWQESKGIKLVRPTLPIMPRTVEEIVAVYRDAITPKTKIISMCHVVNTNGMILPVKEVAEMAHEKGILVAVDGAQSAGMFSIDLHDLGCDFYAASSHKWLFSPKGVGVFYAKKESQHHLKPLVVARGHNDNSIRRLENYNTRNLPEVLGLGAAVDFINKVGEEKISNRSYALKEYFRLSIGKNENLILKTPALDSQSAAIQVVEIKGKNVREVKNQLFNDFEIDCRPMTSFNLNALRLSFAIYITKADIDYLVGALNEISA